MLRFFAFLVLLLGGWLVYTTYDQLHEVGRQWPIFLLGLGLLCFGYFLWRYDD